MNLIELLKKRFHKNKVTTTSISSISDLITLPTRNQLSDHPEYVQDIDNFKRMYLNILSAKRTIVSSELTPTNLRNKMNMYVELILNLIESDEQAISFAPNNKEAGYEKLEITCKMAKLKTYFYQIMRLEIETTLRLVALTELLSEKVFFSSRKKNAIREEINNLSSSLLAFQNQKQAIEMEISAYIKDYGNLNNQEFTISNDEEKNLVNSRYQELKMMLKILNIPFQHKRKNISPITEMVLMEQAMEDYIYTHKKETAKLHQELEAMATYFASLDDPEELVSQINELELKYKAFATFGRNLITKEELVKLYELKFKIITKDILDKPNLNVPSLSNKIELECYEEIVFKKISSLLKNEHPLYQNNHSFITLCIPSIVSILKDGKSEFNYWNILNNHELLSFLLSFDKENGLEEYLEKKQKSKSLYPNIDFCEECFTWAENLPLETIYIVKYLNDQCSENEIFNTIDADPYYNLFKYIVNRQSLSRHLPEGIVKINLPNNNLHYNGESQDSSEKSKQFVERFKQLLGVPSNITTPKTLEELSGEIYKEQRMNYVNLNDGLKKIGEYVFYKSRIHTLIIPSSLVTIDPRAFEQCKLSEVYIKDFSKLNLSSTNLDNLMNILFRARKTGKEEFRPIPDSIRRKQQAYRDGRYNTCIDSDLLLQDAIYTEHKLIPNFNTLTIMENDRKVLTITSRDIDFILKRSEEISFYSQNTNEITTLGIFECKRVREYFLELINKKLKARIPSYQPKLLQKKK